MNNIKKVVNFNKTEGVIEALINSIRVELRHGSGYYYADGLWAEVFYKGEDEMFCQKSWETERAFVARVLEYYDNDLKNLHINLVQYSTED